MKCQGWKMEKHLSFHYLKVYFRNGDHVDVWLLYNIYPFVLRPRQHFMNAIYWTKNCYLLLIIFIVTHILTLGKHLVIWYQLDIIYLLVLRPITRWLSKRYSMLCYWLPFILLLYVCVYWHGRVVPVSYTHLTLPTKRIV